MQYRVTINVDEVNKHHTFGEWHMMCDDSNVRERMEAFAMLGFTPVMSIV